MYTFSDLIKDFWVPVMFSLIGALIGHFKRGNMIEFPSVMIDFVVEDKRGFKGKFLIFFQFFLYLIGIKTGANKYSESLVLYPGFFGDLLIGVGTGIVAKCAFEISGANNNFSLILTSTLAGYAGLTYIQKWESNYMTDNVGDKMKEADVENGKNSE
ncbi:hypothetical protein ACE1TI_13420 [Alteribacillus sp. JSM 102045]|uniref:hypothetical protein n=1 Tax=Alteribacillus sp. JSM 102045 TaxID=1562101 RepID=UPI0035BF51F5